MAGLISIYDTKHTPPQLVHIWTAELQRNIDYAIYRFWIAERRMPAGIVMSEQLAREFMSSLGTPLVGDLTLYGTFITSQTEGLPVLGRPAYIDPLFILI